MTIEATLYYIDPPGRSLFLSRQASPEMKTVLNQGDPGK